MGIGIWHKFALTGGGAAALDGIAIATISDGDVCHVYSSGKFYFFVFVAAATDAENSPYVIRPDDYATVGTGVWKMAASPYGDVQVQPEIVSGLPITGGVTGGTITKTGANQLTITPTTCLDSGLTTKLYTSTNTTFTVPHTGSIAANTIYHIFLVKLLTGGTFEFRTYTTEAAVASDEDVDKYRWMGFWRTNASSQLVQGIKVGGLFLTTKASENVLSAAIGASYATIDHSAFLPTSRIAEIEYGARDASASGGPLIMASDDGTNVSFFVGATDATVDDTSFNVWGLVLSQKMSLKPFNASRQFKTNSGTLDLLIHQVRCFV